MNKNISVVFKTNQNGKADIFPPSQMFVNENFKFLIALGGWLVDNDQQYDKLMEALRNIGETRMHLLEQKQTEDKETPFDWEVPTDSNHQLLRQMADDLEPKGRWGMVNIFVYGDNPNWGIYICEYPTILIIGCIEEYVPLFKSVYEVKGNGFAQEDDFISREYEGWPHLRNELIKNYHLMDDDSVNGQNNQPINV